MNRAHSLATALCALLLGLLSACSSEDAVAGGEDFPNTLEGVGRIASAQIDSSVAWGEAGEVSDRIEGPGLDIPLELPATTAAAGGLAGAVGRVAPAGANTIVSIIVDSTARTVTLVSRSETDSFVRLDTLSLVLDSTIGRLPEGDETVRWIRSGTSYKGVRREEWERLEDRDGDSILTPRSGARNAAEIEKVVRVGAWEGRSLYRATPGADLVFETEADNEVILGWKLARRGVDTLSWESFSDGDGDGVAIAPAERGSCLVDLHKIVFSGVLRADRRETRVRMVHFPSDTVKNHVRRYAMTRRLPGGLRIEATMLSSRGALDVLPGDTADVTELRIAPLSEGGDTSTIRYRVILGQHPGREGENRLLAFHVDRKRRANAERRIVFDLKADPSVLDGEDVRSGAFVLRVEYADGSWGDVVATLGPDGMEGVWRSSDGQSAEVDWDRAGALRRWQRR